MDEQYTEAFQLVLEEARKIAGISATKRADLYEEFKAKVYELLQRHPQPGKAADEFLSWLRGRVQLWQSFKRLEDKA